MPKFVTPCVGVWIETIIPMGFEINQQSHPAWVCGLKQVAMSAGKARVVTPCVGVWIETICLSDNLELNLVTPCVGVWIETLTQWSKYAK